MTDLEQDQRVQPDPPIPDDRGVARRRSAARRNRGCTGRAGHHVRGHCGTRSRAHEVAEFGVRVAPTLIDWPTVVELRRQASAVITEEGAAEATRTGRVVGADDRLLLGRAVIRRVVGDHVRTLHRDGADLWSRAQEEQYVEAVENAVFGYGRLQPLLELPDVENIEIAGCDSVVVQYGDGRRERRPPVADSDAELIDAIRFLGQNGEPSRPFDDTHPTITLALGERFRLHAIGFGLSFRPSVVIRQHILTEVSLADLVAGGLMPREVAEFLDAAVLARKSMVIAGDQGAGKTTLLRALIHSIPTTERFGTLETDYELMTHLQPGRENILALQSRVGHGETSGGARVGEFTISDLMPEALRQNLSRLIVGEVRGGEAAAMFEAMQAGTGTMSTTHSHSADSTIDRLASRVAQGGVLTIDEAYRQVAHNIALFIYVRLVDETWKGGHATPLHLRDPSGDRGAGERPSGDPPDLFGHRDADGAGRVHPGRRLRGRTAALRPGPAQRSSRLDAGSAPP